MADDHLRRRSGGGGQRRLPTATTTSSRFAIVVLALIGLLVTLPTVLSSSSKSQARAPYPAFNSPPFYRPRPPSSSSLLEEVLSPHDADEDHICRPTGQIEDACCDYETVEKTLNTPKFYQTLVDLVKTDYFRYYRVDLYRDCPFWVENGLCMNRACTVEKASEEEIPEEYRSHRLSSVKPADDSEVIFEDGSKGGMGGGGLKGPAAANCQCSDKGSDFCHWEDEEHSSESTWVDLIKNPERFTGYAGPGANRVWKAIYEENCFDAVPKGSFLEPPRAKASGGSGFVAKSDLSNSPFAGGPGGLRGLIPNLAAPADPAATEQCLEKRVFYRVISGLHASISTHICHEYLNQTTGQWSPNLECFISRIAQHPERLQNVYFNYVLLVRALARAGDYMTSFNLKPGHAIPATEKSTLSLLGSLVSQANSCPPTFDEASMFKASSPDAQQLKQEFRHHFRNVSAIMDCVGCDKCRLWGKMQVNGLGTAMKILFSFDDEDFNPAKNPALLERSELVALINTLHRFAESLKAVETFRGMYQEEIKAKKANKSAIQGGTGSSTAHQQQQQQQSSDQRPLEPPTQKHRSEPKVTDRADSNRSSSLPPTTKGTTERGGVDALASFRDKVGAVLTHHWTLCRSSFSNCLSFVRKAVDEWRGASASSTSGKSHNEL
ncbi:unnamed protein product [Jaminaea pallidilutea]